MSRLRCRSCQRPAGGLEWAEHAQAEVDRFGDLRLRGDLLNHIGVIRHDQGEYGQAIALHRQALDLRRAGLGEDHPDTGRSLMELGLSEHESGKWDEGIGHVEASASVMAEALGEDHPLVAQVYANLASTSANSGRLAEASLYFERSADVWRRARGPGSLDAAGSLVSAGMTAHRGEDHERETAMFDRAMAIYEAADAPEAAADEAFARVHRAISRMDDDDVQTGVAELAALASELETRAGSERAYTYTWLAIGYGRLGRHDDAVAPLARAMELQEEAATEGPELGRTLFALARNLDARGLRAEARTHAQQALDTLPPAPADGQDRWDVN